MQSFFPLQQLNSYPSNFKCHVLYHDNIIITSGLCPLEHCMSKVLTWIIILFRQRQLTTSLLSKGRYQIPLTSIIIHNHYYYVHSFSSALNSQQPNNGPPNSKTPQSSSIFVINIPSICIVVYCHLLSLIVVVIHCCHSLLSYIGIVVCRIYLMILFVVIVVVVDVAVIVVVVFVVRDL